MTSQSDLPETVIEPNKPLGFGDIAEVIRYRGLLWSMTVRRFRSDLADLQLGIVWFVARPLLMLAVFTMWRNLSGANMGVDMSYPTYLYSGLILWFYFIEAVQNTAGAVQRDAGLIRKVYFPRLISPITAVLAPLTALAVAAVPLIVIMVLTSTAPDWKILLLPIILLQAALLAFGLGCLFAALSVNSNDWDRALALALYIGLFISPVIFSPTLLTESRGYWVYHLNPMAGTLVAVRSTLEADMAFPVAEFAYSAGFTLVSVLVGFLLFQRLERALLDRL